MVSTRATPLRASTADCPPQPVSSSARTIAKLRAKPIHLFFIPRFSLLSLSYRPRRCFYVSSQTAAAVLLSLLSGTRAASRARIRASQSSGEAAAARSSAISSS